MGRARNPIDKEEVWKLRFSQLVTFKKERGHCNVPQKYSPNRQLAYWVHNQRTFWKKHRLRQDRIDQLNNIAFTWDVREAEWEEMYAELRRFKEVHNSFLKPRRWKGDRLLERWAHEQRKLHRKGHLNPQRFEHLERIGFNWDAQESSWEEMYSALVSYKQSHGNCDVPHRWPANRSFGNWVAFQRTLARKGKLSKERMDRLEQVGFRW